LRAPPGASQIRNVLKLKQITQEQLAAEIEAIHIADWHAARRDRRSCPQLALCTRTNWAAGGPDSLFRQPDLGS
jgi:hypothetical protein